MLRYTSMTRMLLACFFSVFCIAPALAQTRPDFSGTWTMDEKRSTSATAENFVSPVVWVIQQTPEQLVLERKRGAGVDRFTYPLVATRPGAPDPAVKAPTVDAPGNRGYWTGDRLMLETHLNIQGKTVTAREVLTLGNAGEMNVERVVEVEHGYTMKGAQNFNSAKDVFRKAQ